MKARRIATIIGELTAKVAEIVTGAVRPLVEQLKPLLEKIRRWADAARTKFLGRSGPAALYSRSGALSNREVLEGNVGLRRTMETVVDAKSVFGRRPRVGVRQGRS